MTAAEVVVGREPMTLDVVLDRLRGIGAAPHRSGAGWMARCPLHEDDNPSMSVKAGDSAPVVAWCYACRDHGDRGEWFARLLARLEDPTPLPSASPGARRGGGGGGAARGTPTAAYDYTDADGATVARKVRFVGDDGSKSFTWSRPYGQTWAHGLGAGRKVEQLPLYRLPELLAADPGATVYVVEGEKDADNGAAAGMVTTTSGGGASGPLPDDLEALRDRDVVVVADNDPAGHKYARAWAARLEGVAARVRLALPGLDTAKADLSDHLAAGLGADDLRLDPRAVEVEDDDAGLDEERLDYERRVEWAAQRLRIDRDARALVTAEGRQEQPLDVATLDEVLARPEVERYRVAELLPTGGRLLLTAQRKAGKTTATLNLARSLLTGEPFLDRFEVEAVGGRVALLNFEVSAHQAARWAHEADVPADRFVLVNLRGRRNPLGDDHDRAQLAQALRRLDVRFAVVDPFGRAYAGASQNDAGEVGAFLVGLDRFADEAGVEELVLTAHAGWDRERTRGSSALEDWADSIATLTVDDDSGDRFLRAIGRDVEVEEDRLDYDPATRRLVLTGGGSRKAAAATRKVETLADALVEVVGREPGATVARLTELLRAEGHAMQRGDVGKAAALAETHGRIVRQPGKRNAVLHFISGAVVPSRPEPSQGRLVSSPDPSIGDGTTRRTTQGVSGPDDPGATGPLAPALADCRGCGLPLPAAVLEGGLEVHPSCEIGASA